MCLPDVQEKEVFIESHIIQISSECGGVCRNTNYFTYLATEGVYKITSYPIEQVIHIVIHFIWLK